MNHHDVHSVALPLPVGITFEVPRAYAAYCGGRPVRVHASSDADDDLTIQWNEQFISFTHSGTTVEVDRESVLGLVVNDSEQISGMEACTLRIGLTDIDGSKASYPILSSNPRMKTTFVETVDKMRGLSLPVAIFSSVQSMLRE